MVVAREVFRLEGSLGAPVEADGEDDLGDGALAEVADAARGTRARASARSGGCRARGGSGVCGRGGSVGGRSCGISRGGRYDRGRGGVSGGGRGSLSPRQLFLADHAGR